MTWDIYLCGRHGKEGGDSQCHPGGHCLVVDPEGEPGDIVEMFVFLDVDSFSSAPWSESKIPSLENKIHVDRNRRRELHISEFSNGTVTAILQRIKVKKSQSYFNFVWTVGKVTLYWN